MFSVSLFKFINKFLKYYVVCSSLIMTIHCLLMLFRIDTWMIDLIIGLSLGGFISLYITSYILGYCWLFRNFLIHQFLVSCCITWHIHIGFGYMLYPMVTLMLTYGIILLCVLMRKRISFFKDRHEYTKKCTN